MEDISSLIFWLIILIVAIFLIRVPVIIAKMRGIKGSELSTIDILSWVGVFFGITWLIALLLALIWKPTNWVDKDSAQNNTEAIPNTEKLNHYEMLEKLNTLKEKGIITEKEFQMEKEKIMKLI